MEKGQKDKASSEWRKGRCCITGSVKFFPSSPLGVTVDHGSSSSAGSRCADFSRFCFCTVEIRGLKTIFSYYPRLGRH